MTKASSSPAVRVQVGAAGVLIYKPRQSTPLFAKTLGLDRDAQGRVTRIWLDRMVHRPGERWENGSLWDVSGAVTSILTRSAVPLDEDPLPRNGVRFS